MMFSYQKIKHTLLFAIIALGAITAVGIASTVDNDANESADTGITNFGDSGIYTPFGADNGGGLPNSFGAILGADNGGGLPN